MNDNQSNENNVNSTNESFKNSPMTSQTSYKAFEGSSKKSSGAGFGKTVILPFCMRYTWCHHCNWYLFYCSWHKKCYDKTASNN